MSSLEALPDDNNIEAKANQLKEELDHLRHERNVYEESYIRIQRELDQVQKENESLQDDLKAKQELIDAFDLQLQQERDEVKNEMGIQMQEMRINVDEREKELVDNHLEERSNMESLIGELKVISVRIARAKMNNFIIVINNLLLVVSNKLLQCCAVPCQQLLSTTIVHGCSRPTIIVQLLLTTININKLVSSTIVGSCSSNIVTTVVHCQHRTTIAQTILVFQGFAWIEFL